MTSSPVVPMEDQTCLILFCDKYLQEISPVGRNDKSYTLMCHLVYGLLPVCKDKNR
jgi:hypothetical protein